MLSWLADLDTEQRDVATSDARVLRVLAGAGTGKTTALVSRVANEIGQRRIPGDAILLMTFTRRAAKQMVNRCEHLLQRAGISTSARPVAGTFHSIAYQYLRSCQDAGNTFSVIDRSDSADLMTVCRADHFRGKTPPKRFPRSEALLACYSAAINRAETVTDVVRTDLPWARDDTETILAICRRYRDSKIEQRLLDFDDLLLNWLASLTPDGPSPVSRWRHVLVDEYQDVNSLQAQIVAALATGDTRLTVVGDDAQSIYSFRGSSPRHILDFTTVHPSAQTMALTRNYRSTPEIVAVPNVISAQAPEGFSTQLVATRPDSRSRPELLTSYDDEDQAIAVCESVLAQVDLGRALRDQAVLVRAATHSANLELELTARKIPFVKYGGLKYLETAHVKDVLAAFRLTNNPRDELAWLRVLTMVDGVGKTTVHNLLEIVKEELAPESESIAAVAAELVAAAPARSRQTVAAVLTAIAPAVGEGTTDHALRIVACLSPLIADKYSDGESRLQDLTALVHAAESVGSLAGVAADHIIEEPSRTSGLAGKPRIDDDYLVISTIHSAKGLEWECVHILNVTDGFLPLDMALGDPDGLAEERRLLYVATTRARDRLTIHTPVRFHANHFASTRGHVWGQPSRFLTAEVRASMQEVHRHDRSGAIPRVDLAQVQLAALDLANQSLH